jgi:hypothetical protein
MIHWPFLTIPSDSRPSVLVKELVFLCSERYRFSCLISVGSRMRGFVFTVFRDTPASVKIMRLKWVIGKQEVCVCAHRYACVYLWHIQEYVWVWERDLANQLLTSAKWVRSGRRHNTAYVWHSQYPASVQCSRQILLRPRDNIYVQPPPERKMEPAELWLKLF